MSSEQEPQFRIVGNAPEDVKEQVRRQVINKVFDHFNSLSTEEQKKLESLEYPKSDKELACVRFANEETDQCMKEAGVEPYDIPNDNFHVIPPDLFKQVKSDGIEVAFASYCKQGILFDAKKVRTHPLFFGTAALHEALHLKGHQSFEVYPGSGPDDIQPSHYRAGWGVFSSQQKDKEGKEHEHFKGVHEAVVATQEKTLFPQLLDLPEFSEEKIWLLSEEAKVVRKKIAEEHRVPEGDIEYFDKEGERWEAVGYPKQREVLTYVCGEIAQEFPEQFASSEDVFIEFRNAQFNGRLLTLARLMDKTFGEGSFRDLGNMSVDSNSGIQCMEVLRKARLRVLKKKEKEII